MVNRIEVSNSIDKVLLPFSDCIAWEDMSDRGNPCFNPYNFASSDEEVEAAYTFVAVFLEIPKGSERHRNLAKKVADQLGKEWITYDYLIKIVSRLLARTSFKELLFMAMLSRKVKNEMKSKGLKHINSMKEALN